MKMLVLLLTGWKKMIWDLKLDWPIPKEEVKSQTLQTRLTNVLNVVIQATGPAIVLTLVLRKEVMKERVSIANSLDTMQVSAKCLKELVVEVNKALEEDTVVLVQELDPKGNNLQRVINAKARAITPEIVQLNLVNGGLLLAIAGIEINYNYLIFV
jgi:hypothetical protein